MEIIFRFKSCWRQVLALMWRMQLAGDLSTKQLVAILTMPPRWVKILLLVTFFRQIFPSPLLVSHRWCNCWWSTVPRWTSATNREAPPLSMMLSALDLRRWLRHCLRLEQEQVGKCRCSYGFVDEFKLCEWWFLNQQCRVKTFDFSSPMGIAIVSEI